MLCIKALSPTGVMATQACCTVKLNSPVSESFFPCGEHPNNCNISQILPLYKVWRHYNKFDSMKSLVVYYWQVKMTRCGCVEHGLEYFTFHVQKHIEHLATCSGHPAGSRQAAMRARISETRLLFCHCWRIIHVTNMNRHLDQEMFYGVHIWTFGWPIHDFHVLVLQEICSGLGCVGRSIILNQDIVVLEGGSNPG